MLRAACHCTAVRLEVDEPPGWVNDCNCTICRRYGALWQYVEPQGVRLVEGAADVRSYVWGDRELAFERCRICGCVTHFTVLQTGEIRAVNMRMMPALDPAQVVVIHSDNAHTGRFWTRSDRPVRAGMHPKMDPPGPDDWR